MSEAKSGISFLDGQMLLQRLSKLPSCLGEFAGPLVEFSRNCDSRSL
jgi:hypothetical protein